MCVWMCVYVCACVCVRVRACVRACVRVRVRVRVRVCMQTSSAARPRHRDNTMCVFWHEFSGVQNKAQDSDPCQKMIEYPLTHCTTLQHTAIHCNTLQHTATYKHGNTRPTPRQLPVQEDDRISCDTLQHTATHCST